MGRVLILLSVALIAFHAQCVAACSLFPCNEVARHAAPPPETSCHHHKAPAPADAHDSQACGHSQLVSEDGVRVVAPAMEIVTFELIPLAIVTEPALAPADEPAELSPPPPLLSAALSRAVLRV